MKLPKLQATISTLLAGLLGSHALGCANGKIAAGPGVVDGELAKCEQAPRCVSSVDPRESFQIEPIECDKVDDPLDLSKIIVESMGGEVVMSSEVYLGATFTSSVFRFVDDFELLHDKQRELLQVRSSSRIGYYDFDVNRNRVEKFREEFEKASKN